MPGRGGPVNAQARERGSDQLDRPGVLGQQRVGGDQRDAFVDGLGDENAVEGVFVVGGSPIIASAWSLVSSSSK